MPIEQAKEPCWILPPQDPRAGLTDENDPDFWHWPSEASARKHLRDYKEDGTLAFVPSQLPQPCWQVRCDGTCEAVLDEDAEYAYCFPTAAEARSCARSTDWRETGDGRIFCEPDAPEGATPPRSAEQIPGQLTLGGSDVS